MLLARRGRPEARALNKSARELRQGGSNYRCCIPALAGFVSPQSIAPDGKQISMQDRHNANLGDRVRMRMTNAARRLSQKAGLP